MKTPHFPLAANAFLRGVALRGAAFGVLAAAITQSALAAHPSNGERLAMRWCAACHVVSNAQREANADAPPFEEIAKRFSEPGQPTRTWESPGVDRPDALLVPRHSDYDSLDITG